MLYQLTGTVDNTGEKTFTAPANAALEGNLDYFVVFQDTNTPNHHYSISRVDDDDVDSGLTMRGLSRRWQRANGGTWSSTRNQAIAIELIGATASTNTAPEFSQTSLTRSIAENTATNTNIEDSGETFTLRLSNVSGTEFDIAAATGTIYNDESEGPGASGTPGAGNTQTNTGTNTGAALTAALLDALADGHGGSAFALTLRFSEEFPLSFRTLRDSALSVTNGTLTGVARTTAGENREWTLEVTPDGDTAVTVTLAAPASQLTLGGRPVNLAALSGHPQGRRDPAAERTAASPHVLNSGQVDPAAGSADPDADPFDVLSSRYTLDDTAWGIADLNSDPAALHADPSAGSDPAAAAVGAGGKATLLERLAWKLLTQDNWSVDRRQFLSRSSFDLPLSALKGETDDEQAPATGPCGAAAR